MDAAEKSGRNPVSKYQIQPECGDDEQADAGRDGGTYLARPNFLARTGTGKYPFSPYSADHEQDWQPDPVDPYSANIISDDHTYRHTCIELHTYSRR